jgi:VanZ family protein
LALAETEMIATPPGHDVSDKVMHFGAFAIVSLLFCQALAPPPTTRRLAAAALAATAITSGVAVLVEYAQRYLTAGRSFEGMDIVAGCAGAAMMSLWWWLVRHAHVAEEAAPAESPELPLA